MKYAVIKYQGHQYKVSEGQELLVSKLSEESKPEVLLIADEGKVKVGKPVLKEAKLKIKVLAEEEKGEKLHIYKFKAKSRYRRKTGFRPLYSKILIEKISLA